MPPPDIDDPVTILGAGIVGICTALSLRARGVPVRIIDRAAPGQATSMGNAGVVSPWSIVPQTMPGVWRTIPKLMLGYGRPLSIHPRVLARFVPWGLRFLRYGTEAHVRRISDAMSCLCDPSIELYQKHLRGTGHETLIRDSAYVHAFRDGRRATLKSLDYQLRAEKGAPLELVGRDCLAEIEPALSTDFSAAVMIWGQARIRSPGRLGEVLAAKAGQEGTDFVAADILGLQPADQAWTVSTTAGLYRARRVIVAMGAWSPNVLRGILPDLPLLAERGYHIECPEPGIELNNSVMDVDAKVVASSMEDGLRVAGQAEFAPIDAPPNPKRQKQLGRIAQAAFPDLRIGASRFWMGRRPSFPDSLPVLGSPKGCPGLFLNFGHSHYGLMMAPKSGELTAQMVCDEVPNEPMSPYAADRHWRSA